MAFFPQSKEPPEEILTTTERPSVYLNGGLKNLSSARLTFIERTKKRCIDGRGHSPPLTAREESPFI